MLTNSMKDNRPLVKTLKTPSQLHFRPDNRLVNRQHRNGVHTTMGAPPLLNFPLLQVEQLFAAGSPQHPIPKMEATVPTVTMKNSVTMKTCILNGMSYLTTY